jgi:UDP-N-acetylglucosamine--N-acetylmuramyl-(pentapeptide) pyrophosphoryl-undecaprenol N-acetylglucosamine transferase
MKIGFTGGGTGGHFFPIIAVAEELNAILDRENFADVQLYYFSDAPYDQASLYEQHLEYVEIPSGKMHLGGGAKNIGNIFEVIKGIWAALGKLYTIFPDVIFGKGGYASFPTLFAARLLGIPVIIHESDSHVGRANAMVSKWAKRIAVSYAESVETFPKQARDKIAHTGQPIRNEVAHPITEGAMEYLKLEPDVPTILIVGGSQGANLQDRNCSRLPCGVSHQLLCRAPNQ